MTSESEVEQSDRSKADLNSTALQLQELISTVKSGLKTKIMIVLFLIIRLCCGQKTDDKTDIQAPKSKSYHSKSVKIVPEFRFTAVVWNSTNKYLLGFIAVTFTSFLKHIK